MIAPAAQTAAVRAVVSHATPDEVPAIVSFTKVARTRMFPMLDSPSHEKQANRELATFRQTYLDDHHDHHPGGGGGGGGGAFFTARVDGVLVATIGYVPYDHRFPQLQQQLGGDGRRVVEVVRLYVDPAFRRTGLASRLFAALERTARQRGVEQLYLHTHPFLPGAATFWERHGFSTIHVDQDPVWRTIHMSLYLQGRERCAEARPCGLI